jgi:DNA-binding GntR family transcriptional regulator
MVRNSSLSKLLAEGHITTKTRKSLGEETADTLRELILLEKLAPGTSIPERDLAELLGISRTPMREAMRLLETEGLIEYTSTRRPYVANPTFDDICEYLTVISCLEALAGELACTAATDEQLHHIKLLNEKMQSASNAEAALNFFELDMQFHCGIVNASVNAPLIDTHTQYNRRLFRARFVSSRMRLKRTQTLSQHQKITDALMARDKDRTAAELRGHIRSAVENIKLVFESDQEFTQKHEEDKP